MGNEEDVECIKKVNGSKYFKKTNKTYEKNYLVIWDVPADYDGDDKETWEPKEHICPEDIKEFEDKKKFFIVKSVDENNPDVTTCKTIKQFRVTWENPEDSTDIFETWELTIKN